MSELESGSVACHGLLLSLAGRLPDDLLREARLELAQGEVRSAASIAVTALAEFGLEVTEAELEVARQLVEDEQVFEELEEAGGFLIADEAPEPVYDFAETGPDGVSGLDEVDEVVVRAAESVGDEVSGVWRSWRRAVFGDEPDRRVYVVQTEDLELAPALAKAFYDALEPAEAEAGVEVVSFDGELDEYQRLALDQSLLLWTGESPESESEPEFQVTRVYDLVDPVTGPGFHPDHPRVTDPEERRQLLNYLASGHMIISTTSRMTDPLDASVGEAVPLGFLTDGEWIWTEGVSYFLARHQLEPDADLVAYIRRRGFRPPQPPDHATLSRACAFVMAPPEDEAEE